MNNGACRWLLLLLIVGFSNSVLADYVQDEIAALKDQDEIVRNAAAIALGILGDARAVEPLIPCLKDQALSVRSSAIQALGKLGDVAVEPLIACLKDQERFVQESAASALGELGDKRAVEPLIAYLKGHATLFL